MSDPKIQKFLGQDVIVLKNQLMALYMNLWAWFVALLASYGITFLQYKHVLPPAGSTCAVSILGPGGLDQLKVEDLGAPASDEERVTVGCNMKDLGYEPPYYNVDKRKTYDEQFHSSCVLIEVDYFSINYADVCIRWGLYESALRFVGFPIVPGFDFSGKVTWAGKDASKNMRVGENVFGFSLFGAYSRRVLVPARQVRVAPKRKFLKGNPTYDQSLLAGVPAAAATALHAVALARAWPEPLKTSNKAVLIHSAAGGVGSQLVRAPYLCRILCVTFPVSPPPHPCVSARRAASLLSTFN